MLSIIFGLLLFTLALRIAWVRGYTKGYKQCTNDYIKLYYTPMYNRDTKVMQEMCAILADNPEQQLQRNVKLYYENRRLKKKAILLACKYGRATRKVRLSRLEEGLHWLSAVMEHVVQSNFKD